MCRRPVEKCERGNGEDGVHPVSGGALGTAYRFEERIGAGATGEVWRVRDVRGAALAAKVLRREHADDDELVGRFVRERSLLGRLQHRGVVGVRDLVVEGGRIAIVMELVSAGSLRDRLRRAGPLPPGDAAAVCAATLDALAAAHALGIVHRDVKPDNVLLAESEGEPSAALGDRVRVTDFGIARVVEQGRRTSTGILGTPEYLSPELVTTGEAGPPGDVYACGVMLYELLAGRTPFAGPGTDYTIAHRHVTADPAPLEAPEALWALLEELLAKRPEQRPSAAEAAGLLRSLAPLLDGLEPLPRRESTEGEERWADPSRPATRVRGMRPHDPPDETSAAPERAAERPPELGDSDVRTLVRPMAPVVAASPAGPDEEVPAPRRFSRKMIAAAAGAVLVLLAAAVVAVLLPRDDRGRPQESAVVVTAQQRDAPLPSGLGVERRASLGAAPGTVELQIVYTAQNAPLRAPFLEVVPGVGPGAACPEAEWRGVSAKRNQPSRTGVDVPCAWSIQDIEVPAQSSIEITATVPIELADQAALDEWLRSAAEAADGAVSDPDVAGTAYPVQRIRDIRVVTPGRTVIGTTLDVALVPVWPGGEDPVNPLYLSPAVGEPSSMLEAVAGGEEGVRFSDACSGALTVSADGLLVTTLSVAPECRLRAQVGNFSDLESGAFSITTRP